MADAGDTEQADTLQDQQSQRLDEEENAKPAIGLGITNGAQSDPVTENSAEQPPQVTEGEAEETADAPVEAQISEPAEDSQPNDRPASPELPSLPVPHITVEEDATSNAVSAQEDSAPPPPPKPEIKAPIPRGVPIAVPELERAQTPTSAPLPSAPASPRASKRTGSVTSVASAQSSSRPDSAMPGPSTHRRSSTVTTLSMASQAHPGAQLSTVLITPPLQVLVNSKEARKSASFLAASQRALDLCQGGQGADAAYLHPREIFEPLRLAISNPQTTSVPILITSLDLLSKLISHSFFSEPNGPPPGLSPLPDLITHTISLSYTEISPPQVATQVVKALMAIVLSTDTGMLVHQSSLLKAIRTVYNVFLLSTDQPNQVVAQGGLTQMVHHVFSRVVRPDTRTSLRNSRTISENEARRLAAGYPSAPSTPVPSTPRENGEKMTL